MRNMVNTKQHIKGLNPDLSFNGINKWASGSYYKLTEDIKLNKKVIDDEGNLIIGDHNEWIPIGLSDASFKGMFEGDNHNIEGIYINQSADYQGLFGYVNNSSYFIKNLTLSNSYIKGYKFVGGFIGYIYVGRIENLVNKSTIEGTSNVGGIAGYFYGSNDEANNFKNYGNIKATGGAVGGIIGGTRDLQQRYENLINYGSIKATGDAVGGLIGGGSISSLLNGSNYGEVSGGNNVGGICGSVGGSLSYVSNHAIINGCKTCSNVGGIVGNGGRISFSYNKGTITGSYAIGGIAGVLGYSIISSYNNGKINCSRYCGGIVGTSMANSSSDLYNTGEVLGREYVGGIFGRNTKATTLKNVYNIGQVNEGNSFNLIGNIVDDTNYLNLFSLNSNSNTTKVTVKTLSQFADFNGSDSVLKSFDNDSDFIASTNPNYNFPILSWQEEVSDFIYENN